jgi:hypothetical protein
MKRFIRNALLGAAGLVALSLPAHALGAPTAADTSLSASKQTPIQLAARGYDPSAGSVGFKKKKKKKAKKTTQG